MDWQEPLALGIVAAAAAAFAWRSIRPKRDRFGKTFPCGCAGSGARPSAGLRIEGRRGEKARLVLVESPVATRPSKPCSQ
jgi:hypothetical protein